MMLDDFFTYSEASVDGELFQAQIQLNAGHSIFKGHFPGNPIVPGVCQMQMIKETLEHFFGKPYRLTEAREIKFLAMINPVETPELQLECKLIKIDETSVKVQGMLLSGEKKCLKIKGVLSEG